MATVTGDPSGTGHDGAMDPRLHQGEMAVADAYRIFAEREAVGMSPTYEEWARRVAADDDVLALLASLPPAKRQPNLVFTAARWLGATTSSYGGFRDVVVGRWDEVRATVLARRTQTNEAARCALLLPWLASFRQPLALLEVGASAGLCLLPDRYSYRYVPDGGPVVALDPADGVSDVVLECRPGPGVAAPTAMPEVVWRAGVDLAPVDVSDDDACRWLEALVWPEHTDRRERLVAALGVARRDPPRVVAGDLVELLPELAAQAPADATLVVMHSAVLAYVGAPGRRRFVEEVRALPGHWVSNEGAQVLDLPGTADASRSEGRFVVAVDGVPVALAQPHGRALEAFDLGV